jgi:hypothetical protein
VTRRGRSPARFPEAANGDQVGGGLSPPPCRSLAIELMRLSKMLFFCEFHSPARRSILAFPVSQHHGGRKNMKKVAALVAGGLLLCGGVGVATAGSRCEPFQGTLKLDPGPTNCTAFTTIMRKERIFEDADFGPSGAPAICFSAVISGTLGDHEVTGTSLSAVTADSFCRLNVQPGQEEAVCGPGRVPPDPTFPRFPQFTAATVVTITADREARKDKELGQIFLRDTAVLRGDGYAVEQLIGVGGTKKFSKASVSMEIRGYETVGADVSGTICR